MPLIDKQRLMGSGQVTSASVENEGTFHPKQISGLNQWYDASDASTLTTASIVTSTTSSATSPTDVSGLRLWLDAADTSTIISESLPSPASSNLTSSFTDVVCWLDATDSGSLTTDSWLPTSIASCSLWLDADDASTVTLKPSFTNWADASKGTTATASSEYSISYVASKAIDGVVTGLHQAFISQQGTNEWLQIDFGQNRNIDKVVIWHRNVIYSNRLDGYRLDFYTGSHGSGSVVHTISESPGSSWTSNTSILTASINCRSIRLVNEDATQPQLLEVQEFQAFENTGYNTAVSRWQDKSGNGNHFEQTVLSAQPIYSGSAINDRSVIATDGALVQMRLTCSSPTDMVDGDDRYTNFAVIWQWKDHGGGGNVDLSNYFAFGGVSALDYGSEYVHLQIRSGGELKANHYGSGYDVSVIYPGGAAEFRASPQMITNRSYSSGTELRISGTLGALDTTGNPTINSTGWASLPNATDNDSIDGSFYFAEIIHYNRSLTDAEITTVETYLQNKWGITVATQSTDYYENQVVQWKDKSGNNNHFGQTTSTTQPVLSASSINGQQSVLFDDQVAAQYLSASNIFMTQSGDTTIFAVVEDNRVEATTDWILSCDSTDYALFTSNKFGYSTPGSGYQENARTKLNEPYFCTWDFSSSLDKMNAYINGAHNHNSRPASSKPIGSSILLGGGTSKKLNGYIAEMIFFTRSVSDNERISIERYLSDKYNIASSSYSLRYKQWSDKSGQENHVTQGGWAFAPQYTSSAGSQSFGFQNEDNNSAFGYISQLFLCDKTGSVIQDKSATTFAVFTTNNLTGRRYMINSSTDSSLIYGLGTFGSKLTYYSPDREYSTSNFLSTGQRNIATWDTDGPNASVQFYKDGYDAGLDSSTTANADLTTNMLFVGSKSNQRDHGFNGNFNEILVYTGSVSAADREKIETYLQDKWGVTVATQSYSTSDVTSSVLTQWQDKSGNALHLTASSTASAPVLSANEIYSYSAVQFSGTVSSSNPVLTSSTAVYGTPWYPTSIPSCSLWLDANDASSITLNGSDVSQWQDKSGKGNHFSQNLDSRQPAYITGSGGNLSLSHIKLDNTAQNCLFLDISTDFTTVVGSDSFYTSFVVLNKYAAHGAAADSGKLLKFGNSSNDPYSGGPYRWGMHDNGGLQMYSSGRLSFVGSALTVGQDYICRQRSRSSGSGLAITGSLDAFTTTKSNATNNKNGKHCIGSVYGSRISSFEIGEIIHYNRGLTDAECATVETYLQNKWNITVATQSSDLTSDNNDTAYPTQSVSTEAKSIVSIIKQDNANSGSVWAFVSGSEYDGTLTTNEGGNTDFAYGGTTETSSFTSPFSNSTSSVVTAIWGGEYSKLYKDGILLTSSQNNATLSSSAYLALGTLADPNTTPWYPTSLPSCSLWLDANDASSMTVSGTNISEWRNKSTEFSGLWNFFQDTASDQPALSASAINGKNTVHFGNNDDVYFKASGSDAIPMPLGTDGSVTVFYVFEKLADAKMNHGQIGLVSDYSKGSQTYRRRITDHDDASSDLIGMTMGTPNPVPGSVRSNYSIPKDTPGIFTIQNLEGGSYTTGSQSYDGGWSYDETFPWTPDASYKYMTWGVYASNDFDDDLYANVAEIIFYARHLTAAERTTVETYLQNKWNITVATQSSDIDTDNTLTGSVSTYWSGSIGEMLVYNKAISDKERTRAENYLKQKWRVTGSN